MRPGSKNSVNRRPFGIPKLFAKLQERQFDGLTLGIEQTHVFVRFAPGHGCGEVQIELELIFGQPIS